MAGRSCKSAQHCRKQYVAAGLRSGKRCGFFLIVCARPTARPTEGGLIFMSSELSPRDCASGLPESLAPPDPIDPAALLAASGLATFEHSSEIVSTMERAREMAITVGLPLPAAIVADRQTFGRGQQGARWWQAPGSLAVSVVLGAVDAGTLAVPLAPQPIWSLACGVALAETLALLLPTVRPRVRWPNDIEVQGKKLAGILVETAPGDRVIFGIGVNTTGSAATAPIPLRTKLTTLPDLTGRPLPRQRVLAEFLPRFFQLLRAIAADPGVLQLRYRPLCALTGQVVTIHRGGTLLRGLCRGIAADGALLLDAETGPLRVHSGSLTDPADVWRGCEPA